MKDTPLLMLKIPIVKESDCQTPDFYRKFDIEVENDKRKDDSEDESMKKLVKLIAAA